MYAIRSYYGAHDGGHLHCGRSDARADRMDENRLAAAEVALRKRIVSGDESYNFV